MTRASDIEALRREINDFVGKEVVHKGSNKKFEVEYLSTGVLPFDIILGGGIPRNRYVELVGDYSTLKSYVALSTIARTQADGGVCALIDTEHAYDPEWARYIGVDTDALLYLQPETGEEAVDTMELMFRAQVDLVVLDSIAATLPQQEAGKRLSKESLQPARLAQLLSVGYRKLTAANSVTGVLLINQLREQVGITFGSSERATGGRATGFYASMRINCRKAGKTTRDIKVAQYDKNVTTKEQIGQTYRMTAEKSKLNRPGREVLFDWNLELNEIDKGKFLMMSGMDMGLVTNRGAMWVCNGVTVKGKENFLNRMREDAELQDFLEDKVREAHDLPNRLGAKAPLKVKAVVGKPARSASSARKPIRARGQANSSSTAKPLKKLSK